MKRFAAALALAILLAHAPANAEEKPAAASVTAASALVEKLQLERVLDNMFVNLKGMFAENVIATMMRDDRNGNGKQFFDSIPGGRDRFADILGEEFLTALRRQYPDFKSTAANEYAEAFTLKELDSLNMFFSSGVGEKWLAVSPQVEKSMGEWGQKAGMTAGAEAVSAAIARALKAPANEGKAK